MGWGLVLVRTRLFPWRIGREPGVGLAFYTAGRPIPRRVSARRRHGTREVEVSHQHARKSHGPVGRAAATTAPQSRGGEAHRASEPFRYSPELPWKPVVSPPSVEDKDACAIYASVRTDATPSREPVDLALANLQKMLHRAGNVDGEGDGCGMLVDIPRKIWPEGVRSGGHNPALALDPAFAVAHVFVDRQVTSSKRPPRRSRDPRQQRLPRPGRALGRGRQPARWARPRARRSRTSGRSAASSPTPTTSIGVVFELHGRARDASSTCTCPRSRPTPASTR